LLRGGATAFADVYLVLRGVLPCAFLPEGNALLGAVGLFQVVLAAQV